MTNGIALAIAENEAAVEQKILFPLLTLPAYLSFPVEAVKPKSYLAPTQLDKEAGRTSGYFPDYSVWLYGYPVLIVEAKDPSVAVEKGFREASLYARHLNSRYPTGLNPCYCVLASNGEDLIAGAWDQEAPMVNTKVSDLSVGTAAHEQLLAFCGYAILAQRAKEIGPSLRKSRGLRPYQFAGGQALINSKRPLNTFAADLSPVLRRYFSSTDDSNNREIAERAYVSSEEVTEYDRVLEALLRDRATAKRDTIVRPIQTSKREEPLLTGALREFADRDRSAGQLQIIQGAVGSGKSLFARRYKDLLQPADLRDVNVWAFINFNNSPASLKHAERWLCETFLESIQRENPTLDIYSIEVLKGAFSKQIQQNRARYAMLRAASEADELRGRADDLSKWQSDPVLLAEGIASYVAGGTQRNLVVVMDNVDKLELQSQLDAFQLSLWFLERTKAFVILQMRDETYERYKNSPPLDTFRSGIAFHISPPRFIDVVKRRLDLGIAYLAEHASERQEYVLDNGMKVSLPKGNLGEFLHALYKLIFGRRGNVARILEALAGRDVRKALEMFVSIVTSGHLSTSAITSHVRGGGAIPITEYHIIRILMRTDYSFFSDHSGTITNIFHYDNEWAQPDNFLLSEILFFLSMHRKQRGELGLEGYFSVEHVCDEVQRLGYDRDDIAKGVNYLLNRQLIIADNFNLRHVDASDCVKIQASGYIHLRILCERIEYLHGVLPVTPIADEKVAIRIADFVTRENQGVGLSGPEKVQAIETFRRFLGKEMKGLREKNPFFESQPSGTVYMLQAIDKALNHYTRWQQREASGTNQLDLI